MAEQVIREWLSEYKSLSAIELHSFASSILHNHELIQVIYAVLDDRSRQQHEFLDPVCNQLFSFYRSHEMELQRFVLQFIPSLVAIYLSSVGQVEKRQNCRSIEVLLLGIYNLEVVDSNGTPQVHSFQIPSLAQPSIYHEPITGGSVTLTENALSRLEKGDAQLINMGPFPQVEVLNSQNRLRVMAILLNIYNTHLSFIPKSSLHALCKSCSKLVKQGFSRQGHFQRSSYGNENSFASTTYQRMGYRVPVNASLLLEYLHAVYFAMYNGVPQVAMQTLEDVHTRATYELFAEVLLVTNAIRSSLRLSPAGQTIDGPMGISVALSPTTSTSTISKAIVTNASFRTKKLPDDIPVQEQNSEKSLTTITEETEDNDKSKLPKDKSKEKISIGMMISKKVEKVKSSTRKEDTTDSAAAKTKAGDQKKKPSPADGDQKKKPSPADGEKEKVVDAKKKPESDKDKVPDLKKKPVTANGETSKRRDDEAGAAGTSRGGAPSGSRAPVQNRMQAGARTGTKVQNGEAQSPPLKILPCTIMRVDTASSPTNLHQAGNKETSRGILLSETDSSHITDDTDDFSVESSSEMDDLSSSSNPPKHEMDGNVLQGVVHTIV